MLYWGVDLSETNVLFWCQKRTRKPPAISTRWIHEKGATRPFQTPKEKSKRKKASRFAKRFFSFLQFTASPKIANLPLSYLNEI